MDRDPGIGGPGGRPNPLREKLIKLSISGCYYVVKQEILQDVLAVLIFCIVLIHALLIGADIGAQPPECPTNKILRVSSPVHGPAELNA
jgi:hypothetical protein